MILYTHQKAIIDEDPKKCGLFMGTGSGKTRTALMLARGRTLVIAPKTQVEDGNWVRELAHKIEDGGGYTGFEILSKETFRRDHASLPTFDTVIVDEAHTVLGVMPNIRYKNKKPRPKASQLFDALDEYLQRTQPERLYLCTATIMKSPMTVYGAALLLGKVERTLLHFYEFRQTFYTKLPVPGREVWVPKKDSETKDHLARIVKSLGYTGRLEDYFDVPEQTFITKYTDLTAVQKQRIKELPLEYPDPLVLIGKKHQVENGLLTGNEFAELEGFDNGKIDKILELAEEFPRMIVFCKFRAQIDAIEEAVHKAGHRTFVLHGDIQDRGGLLHAAQNSKEYVFICQAQVSAGWELPECPVMVFASRTYSWVDYEQAKGRIQRANNIKKNLYINLVVRGGVDEAVDKALANKQDFDDHLYAQKRS